jgi:DNA-binding NarL/FixJ family response regulator
MLTGRVVRALAMPTLTAMVAAPRHTSSGQIRLAICDDVREFRELIRFGLGDDPGIEIVGEASDGLEAVAVVSDLRPDVVLLDLSMPKLDGLEVIEALRDRAPDSRIVVLSGFAASRMEGVVIEHGATSYLEKGTSLADIRAAVHEAAAKE